MYLGWFWIIFIKNRIIIIQHLRLIGDKGLALSIKIRNLIISIVPKRKLTKLQFMEYDQYIVNWFISLEPFINNDW